MARALTVQNAEINTASITIRTLQIEGKQVTLAVFRQLPVEDIESDDARSLKGVGWGHVNYYKDDPNDINLVWQKGTELRRCIVKKNGSVPTFWFRSKPYPNLGAEYEPSWNLAEWQFKSRKEENDRYEAERLVAWERHQNADKWWQRYNTLVAPLFELPQLFIAV